MCDGRMAVRMRVRLAPIPLEIMRVLMVFVMGVEVFMLHRLMHMLDVYKRQHYR